MPASPPHPPFPSPQIIYTWFLIIFPCPWNWVSFIGLTKRPGVVTSLPPPPSQIRGTLWMARYPPVQNWSPRFPVHENFPGKPFFAKFLQFIDMISLLYTYCLLNGKSFQQNTYDNKRWLTIVGKIAKNRGKAKYFTFFNKNGNVTPPLRI